MDSVIDVLYHCACCCCSAEELWQASLKVEPLIEEARAAAAAAANQPAAATARVSTSKLMQWRGGHMLFFGCFTVCVRVLAANVLVWCVPHVLCWTC
jgi:hypothetical protein